jgi:N-acetylglucosaminyl-diphospho-decaprenol L-rhamnosyltransferase
MPEVSFIIVSCNTCEVLHACLASIRDHAGVESEIIVIDNASSDGTREMIRSRFPRVRLIANEENVGFSPANNQGIALATGDFIVLLNPDTELRPGAMRSWIDAHTGHGAVVSGPRLENPDGSLQQSAWRVPGLGSAALELIGLHRFFPAHAYPVARFSRDFEPGFVSGAAMLSERRALVGLGGLDPSLFWSEDTDLCIRARAMGRCWYLTGPVIMHIGGESAKRNPRRAISNQLISRIKLARKHRKWATASAIALVVGAHILTRAAAFTFINLLRKEDRADAYRYTWTRYWRYLMRGDRSI